MRKIINGISYLLPKKLKREINILRLGRALVKSKNSYLVTTGYVNSKIDQKLENPENEAVPWMNYGIIAFLQEKVNKTLTVLEYGSGASTLFFARNCHSVRSIEYSDKWFQKINEALAEKEVQNVKMHLCPLGEDYTTVQNFIREGEDFHVVVIDGRYRVKTALNCYEILADDGILILDDSHREYYKPVFDFYGKRGFSTLTFEGIKPGGFKKDQTTIFYRRSNNCFNI